MIDGMISRIREEYHLPATTPVVITGGLAPLVTAECRQPMTYEKDLTLMGLYHIYTATAAAKAKR
jgi:pantothenate kinase type III